MVDEILYGGENRQKEIDEIIYKVFEIDNPLIVE